ncbi:MAG: MFS transporter [Hyphomicrobiaceae bacterium]|nr:MFS transporter [Hyphomicrobiaceae bacterium]
MAPPANGRQPVWRQIPSGIWAIGMVSLLMDVSSEMIHALLPVYLVTAMGASPALVGLIEGIAEATASITKIFSGAISDWLGRRKLLAVIGYGLAALTKPIFPLASSIGWLMVARFVDRVGKGIRGAPRDALVADIAPPELRGASFGLRQSLDTIGALLGPAIAIGLMWLTADNFRVTFWAAVLPAFACVTILIFAVREPETRQKPQKATVPLAPKDLARLGRAFWGVTAFAGLFTLARFSEAFLILKSQDVGLPIVLAPVVLVVMNAVYALSSYPAGVLSDGMKKTTLLAVGLVALVLADVVLALASGLFGFGIGLVLWGLHMGLTQGLLSSLVADTVPAELRGTGFGVFNLVSGLSLLAASFGAGLIWAQFGPGATFWTGAAIACLSLAVLMAFRRGR